MASEMNGCDMFGCGVVVVVVVVPPWIFVDQDHR